LPKSFSKAHKIDDELAIDTGAIHVFHPRIEGEHNMAQEDSMEKFRTCFRRDDLDTSIQS